MQNAEQLDNAYNTLANSAGSSAKEQEAYMDSLEGKINALKESFVGLSIQMTNSDMLKGFIDGLTSSVGVVSNLIDIFGAFPTAVSAVIGAMTLLNSKFRENSSIQMGLMIPGYSKITNSLKSVEQALTTYRAKQIIAIDVSKKFATGVEGGVVSTKGFATELMKMQGKLALTTTALVATKVATIALQMALSIGVGLAISAVISGVTSLGKALFSTGETMASCSTQASELSTALNNIGSDGDLVSQYEELNNKIKDNAQTAEEVKTLNEQIVQVKAQLGADDDYYWVLNDEKLTLEEQLSLIKQIRAEKLKDQAKELDDEMPSKNSINNKSDQLELDVVQWQKLTDAIANADSKGQTMFDGHTVSAKAMQGVLEEVEERIKSNSIEIQSYNGNLKLMEEAGYKTTRSEISMSDTVNDVTGKINAQTQAIEDNTNAKKTNGNEGVGDVDTSGSQDSVSALEESYKSLGYTAEEVTQKIAELNAMTEEERNSTITGDFTKAYHESAEAIKDMKQEIVDLNEESAMTPEIIQELINKYPEIAQLGTGLEDLTTVQQYLTDQIAEQANVQSQVYQQMIANDQNYYNQKIKNNEGFVSALNSSMDAILGYNTEAYGIDLNNFSTLNELKNSIQNQFGTAQGQSINGILDMYNQAYSFDGSNFADLQSMKQGYMNQLIPVIANWIASFTNGNASGYTSDLSNFNDLAEMKAYAIAQLSQKMVQLQSEWSKVIDSYNSSVEQAYANGNENKAMEIESQALRKVKPVSAQMNAISSQLSTMDKVFSGLEAQLNTYEAKFDAKDFTGSISPSGGSSSGKGSGGGGGGSSSGNKESEAEKDVEDLLLKIDRYKNLNTKIQQIANEIEKNRALQETASGEQLAQLVQAEQDLLEKQKQAYSNLNVELKKESNEVKNTLSQNGFTFDVEGNISNYEEGLKKLETWANSATGEEKERRQELAKDLLEQVDRYYELINSEISDVDKSIIDTSNKIYDIIIEQTKKKIEIIQDAVDDFNKQITKQLNQIDYEEVLADSDDPNIKLDFDNRRWELEKQQLEKLEEELNKLNSIIPGTKEEEELLGEAISDTEDAILSQKKTIAELNNTMKDTVKDGITKYINALKELEEKQLEVKQDSEIQSLTNSQNDITEEEYNNYKDTAVKSLKDEIAWIEEKISKQGESSFMLDALIEKQKELADIENGSYTSKNGKQEIYESIYDQQIASIDEEIKRLEEKEAYEEWLTEEAEKRAEIEEANAERQNKILELQKDLQDVLSEKNIWTVSKDSNGEWQSEYIHDIEKEQEILENIKDIQDEMETYKPSVAPSSELTEVEKLEEEKKKLEELKEYKDNADAEALESLEDQHDKELEALEQKYEDIDELTKNWLESYVNQYGESWEEILNIVNESLLQVEDKLKNFSSEDILPNLGGKIEIGSGEVSEGNNLDDIEETLLDNVTTSSSNSESLISTINKNFEKWFAENKEKLSLLQGIKTGTENIFNQVASIVDMNKLKMNNTATNNGDVTINISNITLPKVSDANGFVEALQGLKLEAISRK